MTFEIDWPVKCRRETYRRPIALAVRKLFVIEIRGSTLNNTRRMMFAGL